MKYKWRKMSDPERLQALRDRTSNRLPWHRPPCINSGDRHYLFTATCFNHEAHIGFSAERMTLFVERLVSTPCLQTELVAWVVLPNHYHILCRTDSPQYCKLELGKLHGATSYEWNIEERKQGRKIWFSCVETAIKSNEHYWATFNYIHNNPIKHDCVYKQNLWPWSSFLNWQDGLGRNGLVEIWKKYPVSEYGDSWDLDNLSKYKYLVEEFMHSRTGERDKSTATA